MYLIEAHPERVRIEAREAIFILNLTQLPVIFFHIIHARRRYGDGNVQFVCMKEIKNTHASLSA